jgi:cell division protein FtsL
MQQRWKGNAVEELHAAKPEDLRKWLLFLGLLGVWLIASATLYVWLQVQRVNLGYRLAELHAEQEQLVAVQRKLQLEMQRWHEPFYLEKVGREQFGLAPPRSHQRLVIP